MRASLHAFGVAAAVLGLAAVVAPAAGAATVDVQIRDFAFRPALAQIAPGDEVRWVQAGATTHTVTARASAPERFDFELSPGQQARRAFPNPGRFAYHCTIHPEMRGVVQVGPDTTAPVLTTRGFVRGRASARVLLRLSEEARVSVELVRGGRVVRKSKPRRLDEDARSARVRIAGLAAGRYRVRVRAVDVAGNVATARAGALTIASAR